VTFSAVLCKAFLAVFTIVDGILKIIYIVISAVIIVITIDIITTNGFDPKLSDSVDLTT